MYGYVPTFCWHGAYLIRSDKLSRLKLGIELDGYKNAPFSHLSPYLFPSDTHQQHSQSSLTHCCSVLKAIKILWKSSSSQSPRNNMGNSESVYYKDESTGRKYNESQWAAQNRVWESEKAARDRQQEYADRQREQQQQDAQRRADDDARWQQQQNNNYNNNNN